MGLCTSVWQIQNSNALAVNRHLLGFVCITLTFDLHFQNTEKGNCRMNDGSVFPLRT